MSLYLWAAQSNLNQHARGFVRGQVLQWCEEGVFIPPAGRAGVWKRGADQEQEQPVLKELSVHVDCWQREGGWRHKESQQQEWSCPRVGITSSHSFLSWLGAAAICLHQSRGFNLYSSISHVLRLFS